MKFRLAITGALVIAALSAAAPAQASHELQIIHQSPPAAVPYSDLSLAVGVRGCWLFCTAATVGVHYVTPTGRQKTIIETISTAPAGIGMATVTIPGRHVAPPGLPYWVEAWQYECNPFGHPCHEAYDRLPARGAYWVIVGNGR